VPLWHNVLHNQSHDPHAPRVCINGMLCFGTRWKPPITRASTSTWVKLTACFIGQTIQIVGILHTLFGRVPPTQRDLFAQPRNHCLNTSWVKLLGWWWPQNDGHGVPFQFPRMWIKALQATLVVFWSVGQHALNCLLVLYYLELLFFPSILIYTIGLLSCVMPQLGASSTWMGWTVIGRGLGPKSIPI